MPTKDRSLLAWYTIGIQHIHSQWATKNSAQLLLDRTAGDADQRSLAATRHAARWSLAKTSWAGSARAHSATADGQRG